LAERRVDYERLARAARATGLLGTWRRRRAVARLAELSTAQAVPGLCHALQDRVPDIAAVARRALVGLTDQDAKDALCATWARGRDQALGRILVEGRHVASRPVEVAVLSALKVGAAETAASVKAGGVPALVAALHDRDPEIAARARKALVGLRQQDAKDALCALWASKRNEELGRILVEGRHVASRPVEVAVLSALKVAAAEMAASVKAGGVPALVAALRDKDPQIAARAREALVGLRQQEAKDELCALWASERDEELGRILVEGRHVASAPPQVMVLSALWTGVTDALDLAQPGAVEALVEALQDGDTTVAEGARSFLAQVTGREQLDALCDYVIAHPDSPLQEAAMQFGWRHSDVARDCLLLFFTDQIEEYLAQDVDCQYLAEEFRQGDESFRQRVREKVRRSADQRLLRILRTGRMEGSLETGTDTSDLDVAIAVAARHENYQALFEKIERGRYRQIMEIMGRLTAAHWEPADEDDARFYEELLGHYRPLAVLAAQADSQFRDRGLEAALRRVPARALEAQGRAVPAIRR